MRHRAPMGAGGPEGTQGLHGHQGRDGRCGELSQGGGGRPLGCWGGQGHPGDTGGGMGSDTGTLGAARDTQVTLGNTHGCGQLPWLVGSEVGGGHCQPRGGPREGGVGPYLRDRLLREGHVLALQTQREVGAWCGRGGAPIAPPSSSPFLTPPPASLCPPPPRHPHTRTATRCTTCWGSLSRTTLGGGKRDPSASSTPHHPPQGPRAPGGNDRPRSGGDTRHPPAVHDLVHSQEEPLHVLQQRPLLHVLPGGGGEGAARSAPTGPHQQQDPPPPPGTHGPPGACWAPPTCARAHWGPLEP